MNLAIFMQIAPFGKKTKMLMLLEATEKLMKNQQRTILREKW